MGVPNVVYKWTSLRTLYVSVFVMNVAGFVIVVILIVSAVKLRLDMGQYLDLVVPGDANFWPGMMFLIGFLCAPIYAIGTRLCFHLRFSSSTVSIPRLNQVLFVHCALCFASMMIVAGINAVGIIRLVNLQRTINHNGIIESMQEYATEIISKARVDTIQINFRCCGSESFKDWFRVKWMQRDGEISEDHDDRKNETAFVSNDVPFSCCATDILRPCVHHNVLKSSEVYLYHPEERLTISTTGCQAKVLSHARYVGGLLIVGFILLAAYQMVLALLSRLLQTAYSNDFYIGPKKGRYLAWILGSMPKPEIYNRLVYEGRDMSAEERLALLRFDGPAPNSRLLEIGMESEESSERISRYCDNKASAVNLQSNEKEEEEEEAEQDAVTNSSISAAAHKTISKNSIPAPPPSPGEEKKIIPDVKWRGSASQEGIKFKAMSKKRGIVTKVSDDRVKELRESLECLEKNCQPFWKGGSPIFEDEKSAAPGYRLGDFLPIINRKDSPFEESESILRPRSSSPSLASVKKKAKLCGKDQSHSSSSSSLDEIKIRMKKFCKDLSTEYKSSPYSKQRKDFSEEEQKRQDPISSASNYRPKNRHDNYKTLDDDGFMIRNEIRARFNPADAYSRFRGSNQDTMMRRSGQSQPWPPPIPISNGPDEQFSETPQFLNNRRFPFDKISKPQTGLLWAKHQKQGWGPRVQPAPTYFPISSRPPRPPRLPPCPYASREQAFQNKSIFNQSRGVRQIRFMQNNEEGVQVPRFQRCTGRQLCNNMRESKPPRFSGC